MKNFRSDNRSRDRKNSSGRDFGGRDSRRPVLYDAVCDECGKSCKVPFRPSGNKPVYCSDCFEKRGGKGSDRSGRRTPRRRDFDDRATSQLIEKIETLNAKLDKIIDLLSSAVKKKPELVKKKTKKNKKSKMQK